MKVCVVGSGGREHALAMVVGHVQAVDQLVDLDRHGDRHARLREDRGQVRILEGELALDGVVVLVEGAARHDDAGGGSGGRGHGATASARRTT